MEWKIGEKAKKLDQEPISDRIRIEKRSIVKMLIAIGIYFLIISMFSLII